MITGIGSAHNDLMEGIGKSLMICYQTQLTKLEIVFSLF